MGPMYDYWDRNLDMQGMVLVQADWPFIVAYLLGIR